MPIRTSCPKCQAWFNLNDDLAGQKVRCQQCQQVFLVPSVPAKELPLEVVPAEDPLAGVSPSPMAPAHEEVKVREAASVAPIPARRPPLPRRPRPPVQPQAAGTSTLSIVLTLLVVFGCLAIIGAVAVGVYFFIKAVDVTSDSEAQIAKTVQRPPVRPPGPDATSFWLGGLGVAGENPNEGDQAPGQPRGEGLTFDAKDAVKLPDLGRTFVRTDAPVPRLPDPKDLPPTRQDGQMAEDVIDRVENSTVYLRVFSPAGASTGTGFFALDDGVIVTNAHVIGMKETPAKPTNIEAFIHRGKPEERKLVAKVVSVDPRVDLAILKVQGPSLPPPLNVISASGLKKTQVVYAFGFPGGERLEQQGAGKGLSTTYCKVSTLRYENGQLTRVQLDGQLNHGNSGGPIVDLYGNVVGVAVEIFQGTVLTSGTGISFAVPGDEVHYLYHGRVAALTLGQPRKAEAGVQLPVTLRVKGLPKSAKEIGLDWWIGDAGDQRPASVTLPEPKEGDSARQQFRVEPRGEVNKTDLTLPALPPGKVFWFQPVVVNQKRETRWGSAISYAPPTPLENQAIALRRGAAAAAKVEITAVGHLRLGLFGGRAEMAPTVNWYLATDEIPPSEGAVNPETRYRPTDFKIGLNIREMPIERGRFVNFLERRKGLPGASRPLANLDLTALEKARRAEFEGLTPALFKTLEAMDFGPPPGVEPNVGQTWTIERSFAIDPVEPVESPGLKLTCTYVGTRPSDTGAEALVLVEGGVGSAGNKPYAKLEGVAWLTAASGGVLRAQAQLEVEQDVVMGGQPVGVKANVEYRLRREFAKPPRNESGSTSSALE